ncbi:MAG: response regulator [Oscillospiraceae bacterium]|nr:response regulator [Oscillospiraceae bacterium]
MYKLVIVEDERDVRLRLASLIEKAGCNFKVVSEYETGIDAYDGIISDNPDLILTDIRIPYINGIELSKMVREVFPLIKIIIITGYNEFDYAKEAANLGVIGFISKPVALENIRYLLKKAEESLDSEFLTVSNLGRLSAFYNDNLPVIRENELYRLSGMSDVTPEFKAKLTSIGINLNFPFISVCLFDFDDVPGGGPESYDLVFSSIRKSIGDEFDGFCGYDLFSRNEQLCLILKSHIAQDMKETERRIERIVQRASRYSDMPVSAGISSVFHNDKNFAAMIKEAVRALEYRRVMGGQKVFFFGNSLSPASEFSIDDDIIGELGYILRSQSTDNCVKRIDLIRKSIGKSGDSLYYTVTSILNILIRGCDDLEGLYSRSGSADLLYRKLFEIKTDDEIFDYLKELARTVRGLNEGVIVDNVEHSLRLVTTYMETHFCSPDISFDSLAREVNFSVSYISALLRKKLNTSFVKMLTDMRIAKAKELLANPSLKIIDIAERLGYNDSYYFSHCFKKHTGVPPKEFRNRHVNKISEIDM